jgi:hypothetical protein
MVTLLSDHRQQQQRTWPQATPVHMQLHKQLKAHMRVHFVSLYIYQRTWLAPANQLHERPPLCRAA